MTTVIFGVTDLLKVLAALNFLFTNRCWVLRIAIFLLLLGFSCFSAVVSGCIYYYLNTGNTGEEEEGT